MNVSRKDFILGAAAAGVTATAVSGCKKPPAIDSVRTIAYASGAATALVINETKLDAEQRKVIKEIIGEVQKYTPEVGQPISVKLVEVAQVYVDAAVQEGRIKSDAAVLIMAGVRTVSVGFDLLENRYPIVRTSVDYAAAAIDGFAAGFDAYIVIECEDCCENCTLRATREGFDVSVVARVRGAAVRNGLLK